MKLGTLLFVLFSPESATDKKKHGRRACEWDFAARWCARWAAQGAAGAGLRTAAVCAADSQQSVCVLGARKQHGRRASERMPREWASERTNAHVQPRRGFGVMLLRDCIWLTLRDCLSRLSAGAALHHVPAEDTVVQRQWIEATQEATQPLHCPLLSRNSRLSR